MKVKIFQRKFNQGTGSFGPAMGIFAFLLIVSLTILVLPANSGAKDWPNKPISIIVPLPAGTSATIFPRIMAPKMSKILGVAVNVVNKPGGAGIIGTLEVYKSPPDGYTLIGDGPAISVQYAWHEDLPYKVEDRTFIARAFVTPLSLVVPASSPWKTLEDLANAIRNDPSSISYGGSGGTGSTDVVIAQFLGALKATGVDISKTRTVSFQGTGQTVVAVAGGHVSFTCSGPASIDPFIAAGKARALAVTTPVRYKGWPNVPTTAEAGFPSVNLAYWTGLFGPPGMPANIVKILGKAIRETVNDPDIIAQIDKVGGSPSYLAMDEFKKFVLREGEGIKALKLK